MMYINNTFENDIYIENIITVHYSIGKYNWVCAVGQSNIVDLVSKIY